VIYRQQRRDVANTIPPRRWNRWLSRAWDLVTRAQFLALLGLMPGLIWSFVALVIAAKVPVDSGTFRSSTFLILTGVAAMHVFIIGRNVAEMADGGQFKLRSFWRASPRLDTGAIAAFFLIALPIAASGPLPYLQNNALINVQYAWATMSDADLVAQWNIAAHILFSVAQTATIALTPSALLVVAIQSCLLAIRCAKARLVADAIVWLAFAALSIAFAGTVAWWEPDASLLLLISAVAGALCIAFPFVCFVVRQEFDHGIFENLPKGFRAEAGALIQATRAGDHNVG